MIYYMSHEVDEAVLQAARMDRLKKIESNAGEIFQMRARHTLTEEINSKQEIQEQIQYFTHCAGAANSSFLFEPLKAAKAVRDICGNSEWTILACGKILFRKWTEYSHLKKIHYSAAQGNFFWAECLNFLQYISIYVSHDPNFLPFDRAMLEPHFLYLGNVHICSRKISRKA